MKKNILIVLLLFSSVTFFSQQNSTLDSISKKTCEFLNSDKFKNTSKNEKINKLGIYIIELYAEFKKELKNEGVELDFSKGKEGGREFGEKVGINMVKFCPDALLLLSEKGEDEKNEKKTVNYVIDGRLKSITGKEINTVILKDEEGKIQKFIWLINFEGSERLIASKNIKNLKVRILYTNVEMFSPKLQEYVIRKQITKIEYLE